MGLASEGQNPLARVKNPVAQGHRPAHTFQRKGVKYGIRVRVRAERQGEPEELQVTSS